MNLQELFKNDLDEQMPGLMQRLKTGIRAAAGDDLAIGDRRMVQVTKQLASKIKQWAGGAGGLTVENLRRFPEYKDDKGWQEMLNRIEGMYGADTKINPNHFDDELLSWVRQRATRSPNPSKVYQTTRGIDSNTRELLNKINDVQLKAWIDKAEKAGMDPGNAVLIAAKEELNSRSPTQAALNLGPGGGAQAGATPE